MDGRTDGRNERTDAAKTISLRLRRRIMSEDKKFYNLEIPRLNFLTLRVGAKGFLNAKSDFHLSNRVDAKAWCSDHFVGFVLH